MKKKSIDGRIIDALKIDRALERIPPKVEIKVNGVEREVTIHSPGDTTAKELWKRLEESFARKRRKWLEYHLKRNNIKITKE